MNCGRMNCGRMSCGRMDCLPGITGRPPWNVDGISFITCIRMSQQTGEKDRMGERHGEKQER